MKEPMKDWARERVHCTRGEEGENTNPSAIKPYISPTSKKLLM
jgi:hypothetical protein